MQPGPVTGHPPGSQCLTTKRILCVVNKARGQQEDGFQGASKGFGEVLLVSQTLQQSAYSRGGSVHSAKVAQQKYKHGAFRNKRPSTWASSDIHREQYKDLPFWVAETLTQFHFFQKTTIHRCTEIFIYVHTAVQKHTWTNFLCFPAQTHTNLSL